MGPDGSSPEERNPVPTGHNALRPCSSELYWRKTRTSEATDEEKEDTGWGEGGENTARRRGLRIPVFSFTRSSDSLTAAFWFWAKRAIS